MTPHPAPQISGFLLGGFGVGALFTSTAMDNWPPGLMLSAFALLCAFLVLRRRP